MVYSSWGYAQKKRTESAKIQASAKKNNATDQGDQGNGVSYGTYGTTGVSNTYAPSIVNSRDSVSNGSNNNSQNNRSNESRLGGRIPDIFGKVLSVPDKLGRSYIVGSGDFRYELDYYCVGRGSYELGPLNSDDDALSSFTYVDHDIYQPNTSPLSSTGTIGLPFSAVITSDILKDIHQNLTSINHPFPNFIAGPYFFDKSDNIAVTFAAPFISTGYPSTIGFTLRFREVDENNVAFGATHTETTTIPNTNNATNYTAYQSDIPFKGRFQVTFQCTSSSSTFAYSPLMRYLYGVADTTGTHFGDITTVRVSRNIYYFQPTVKLGVISCEASRKIGGVTTSKFSDIAKEICLDSKIGNRQLTDFDSTTLAALHGTVQTYFGTSLAAEFNHTFDDADTSFEETLNTVCQAAFVKIHRVGPTINFVFEKEDASRKLLFNHRNKIPNSELRTVNFGYRDEKDGVSFQYTNTRNGAKLEYILPADESADNVTSDGPVGITNKLQAYFHAHRQLNLQKYQNTLVEFQATQEANLLVVGDIIQVADNTRTDTYDGEVISQDGVTLVLSQPYTGVGNATMFLQTIAGSVEAIDVASVSPDGYTITLDSIPAGSLSLGNGVFSRATYEIVVDGSSRRGSFLVLEKAPNGTMLVTVKAGNYDARFYSNDKDYINTVVDINGDLV